jgi:NAD(P)-dependent dehydrogenase (short-subunit alcohol dehydrogenase family)
LLFGGLGGIAVASGSLFLKRGAKLFVTDLADEDKSGIEDKYGTTAKVEYARCDVSVREQVEGRLI